jgi:hypothetical protein
MPKPKKKLQMKKSLAVKTTRKKKPMVKQELAMTMTKKPRPKQQLAVEITRKPRKQLAKTITKKK